MLGGAVGSVVRYALSLAIMSRYTGPFPVATFLINVTGSFLIGFAMTLIPDHGAPYLRPLLVTGMLGGYTTFSAFEWESYVSSRGIAILYVAASVGLGFAACWTGAVLATR
jgi:CrcB protein